MRINKLTVIYSMLFLISLCFLGCEKIDKKEKEETKETEFPDELEIPAGVLVLDDFNDGDKINNLGGEFGSWNKDPGDSTQYCRDSLESVIKINKIGYSLRLDYDVDSPNPAYNGFWVKLNNKDFNSYTQLIFYVKGDKTEGYTNKFKIELKNAKGRVGRYLVSGITDYWKRVIVPLKELKDITDWQKMTEFVIVFDDLTASKKAGTIYIDDICLQ